ncbi:MAG: Ig-like domain-containing protein [Erysipelotrichaceae bacterium]|nr:Ig-like domain-containing protein [Erysipelotrichaceae bacterium]
MNFDTDGGEFMEAVAVSDGSKVAKPADPVKEGYDFLEWQLNGETYDFSTPVTGNITLKAVYDTKTNTCKVIIEGKYYTLEFKEGETITLEAPTSSKGKSFVGWMVDGKPADLSSAKDGSTIEAIFEDSKVPCTKVDTPYNSYYAVEGTKPWKLDVIVTPSNTTDKVTFKSDDESIVTVDDDGYVHPGKVGKTKIRITCGDQQHVISFETRSKKVSATAVNVSPSTLLLYNTHTGSRKVTVVPDDTTDKTATYTSSDTSVVMVDSKGNVTGVGPGVATVTVTVGSVSATCEVCVEGEKVVFSMQNNVTLKEASGQKIPYKATHISCYDWNVNKQDVTLEVEFHTAYTSALDIDGNGNVYAKGYIYQDVDIPVYFTYNDGSSFTETSDTYIVRVVK